MKNKIFTLGAPRTGFTLLISIINELSVYSNKNIDNKRFIYNNVIDISSIYLKNEFLIFLSIISI